MVETEIPGAGDENEFAFLSVGKRGEGGSGLN